MRYPVLTRSDTERLARLLVKGEYEPNWQLERTWIGTGEEVSLAGLEEAMFAMYEAYDNRDPKLATDSPESFEGRFSGDVHAALRDLPVEVLDDPGFWRYLSLDHFWWFVAEREAPAIGRGNVMTYVDGGNECVPFRMFLRAQAIRDGDDYDLAAGLTKGADFWRSHILRVRTGSAPALARSFARLQIDKKMVSDDLRPYARQMNRLWTNIVFHAWSEDDCDRLVNSLYDAMYGEEGKESGPRVDP